MNMKKFFMCIFGIGIFAAMCIGLTALAYVVIPTDSACASSPIPTIQSHTLSNKIIIDGVTVGTYTSFSHNTETGNVTMTSKEIVLECFTDQIFADEFH